MTWHSFWNSPWLFWAGVAAAVVASFYLTGCASPPPVAIDPCSGFRRIETHQDTLIQGSSRYNALSTEEWAARRDVKGDTLSVETARGIVAHNRAVKEFCGR